MIVLENDRLEVRFPEVHAEARCAIEFQRTLRIPDDGRDYPLPPGLGSFPLRHLDDHAARLPWFDYYGADARAVAGSDKLRGLRLPQKRVYLRALDVYANCAALDLEDALAVAHMEQQGASEIYSYDTDFDGVAGIRRVEP